MQQEAHCVEDSRNGSENAIDPVQQDPRRKANAVHLVGEQFTPTGNCDVLTSLQNVRVVVTDEWLSQGVEIGRYRQQPKNRERESRPRACPFCLIVSDGVTEGVRQSY